MQDLIIQQYLERIGSLMRAESRSLLAEHGLPPVQFEALVYLSICNRYSDIPKGVTEYLGQTKGTVSQSLKALENKGYIIKKPDNNDGRMVHLLVTDKGQELIEKANRLPVISQYCGQTDKQALSKLSANLHDLLKQLQQINQRRSFGLCKSCRHHINHGNGEYECGLTNEPLKAFETELICREHE